MQKLLEKEDIVQKNGVKTTNRTISGELVSCTMEYLSTLGPRGERKLVCNYNQNSKEITRTYADGRTATEIVISDNRNTVRAIPMPASMKARRPGF